MVTFTHFLFFSAMCLTASLALTTFRNSNYDIYGNYKPREFHKYNPDCCLVPECDEYRRCMDTIRCDHTCSTGDYRKANYGTTPGFRLKETYTKYDCRFGECQLFQFTCNHCPNPRIYDFSIYTIRKDCKDCYETV